MALDWEPGDLALCVKMPLEAEGFIHVGSMYVVNDVFVGYSIREPKKIGLALGLVGVAYPHPDAEGYGAEYFMKVGGRSVNEQLAHEAEQSYSIPVREKV